MTNPSLQVFRDRLPSGMTPELRAEIEAAVVARRQEPGGHTDWALLCEQAGLMSLAFSEFQLALRDDRDDPLAAAHLAQHYRERGDTSRALSLLDRLLQRQPAHEAWLAAYVEILCEDGAAPLAEQVIQRAVEQGLPAAAAQQLRRTGTRRPAEAPAAPAATEPAAELLPTDADCVRFHSLFAGREGVYARQWVRPNRESGYSPVHEPLTPAVIRNHLLGTFTVGVYPIRLDGTATFFALDLDIDKHALQRAHGDPEYARELRETLRHEGPRLLEVLRQLGFTPVFENSGYKGRHYWVFLDQPETADVLHLFGRLLLAAQSPLVPPGLHLEFFPKQANVKDKGLGNLIKVPLGIHRRTGRRSQLLDDQSQPLADPLAALRSAGRASREALYAAIQQLKAGGASAGVPAVPPSADDSPSPLGDAPALLPFVGSPRVPAAGPTGPASAPASAGPPPLPPAPVWTEADFETDPRVRHLLAECPVLAALKDTVNEHRRLNHEEQLVLIHTLGHLEGGPQAVNYLFGKCIDVGPEKLMKDRLKGNPVSCPSIRKKIPHITRRVSCNCHFEFAQDRYPTPVLYLLTLPAAQQRPAPARPDDTTVALAQRFGVIDRQRAEIQQQWQDLRRALVQALLVTPERSVACEAGRYRLVEHDGVEELLWEPEEEGPPIASASAG